METKDIDAAIGNAYGSVTPEGLLETTRDLARKLRKEQEQTETHGHCSLQLHEALQDSGVYALLRDADLETNTRLETVRLLASGCPSTAWATAATTANVMALNSLFSEATRAAVFDDSTDPIVCSGVRPLGTATAADGGWRIRGTWELCDGAAQANWLLARVLVVDDQNEAADSTGAVATVLVPRESFEVLGDARELLGLRGSGTASITVDTEVPEDYLVTEDYLSLALQTSMAGLAAATALGAAQAALEWFDEMIRVRKTFFPPQVLRYQDINYQRYYGRAVAMIEAAAGILRTAAARQDELADTASSAENELTSIAIYQQAFVMSWDAVHLLFVTGGSSAAAKGSDMGRYFRDLSTLRTRGDLQYDAYARDLSRQHFDLTEDITR